LAADRASWGSPRFPLWARVTAAALVVVLLLLFTNEAGRDGLRHFVRLLLVNLVR
jgi:hypothetical protein